MKGNKRRWVLKTDHQSWKRNQQKNFVRKRKRHWQMVMVFLQPMNNREKQKYTAAISANFSSRKK